MNTEKDKTQGLAKCLFIKHQIEKYGGVDDIFGKNRTRIVADLRKTYCFLCTKHTKASYMTISSLIFNPPNHSLVNYNIEKFEDLGKQITCYDAYLKAEAKLIHFDEIIDSLIECLDPDTLLSVLIKKQLL